MSDQDDIRSAGKTHTHTHNRFVRLSESGEWIIIMQKVSRSTTQRFAQREEALTWLSHSEERSTHRAPLRFSLLKGCFFFLFFSCCFHIKSGRSGKKSQGSLKAMGMGFNYLMLTFIWGYGREKRSFLRCRDLSPDAQLPRWTCCGPSSSAAW